MTITDPLVSSDHSDTKMINGEMTNTEGLLSTKIWHNGKECFLSLKDSRLIIELPKSKVTILNFKDIIGVTPCQKKNKNPENDFYFEIHSFGIVAPGCFCCGGSKGERQERVDVFKCESASSYWNWQHAINCAIRDFPILQSDDGDIIPPPNRKVLVVVNPVGGTGIALKIWKNDTEPMLLAANIEYTLLVTEYANHAKHYVSTADLSMFHSILIIGGDGLIFEIVSGLLSREDKDQVLSTVTIAPIPGGSGNGLAMSVLFECGETCTTKVATFAAITGTPSYLDVSRASTKSNSYYSFLSLSWGLVADVDINSESLRWMGEARFTVSGLSRVATKKLYRGRLSMLLANQDHDGIDVENDMHASESGKYVDGYNMPPLDEPLDVVDNPSWKVIEDDFVLLWVVQTSHASTSFYTGPGVTLNDGVFTITLVRNCSRFKLLKILIDMETGTHFKMPEVEVYKAKAYRLEPLTDEGIFSLDGELIEYGPFQCEMYSTSSLQILKTDDGNRGRLNSV